MTLSEQIEEVLQYIEGGPYHWADFDLIMIYLSDSGYSTEDFTTEEIIKELDSQADRHKLILDSKTTINIWATRPLKTENILQEYLEIIS